MTIVYTLRLESDKWYVGKTDNITKRYKDHVNGRGASWTRKYPPIAVAHTIQNATAFDEDKVTKEYMARYGIENVRGGSYIAENLDADQITLLQREIWMANDRCIQCGSNDHFVKDCEFKSGNDSISVDSVSSLEDYECYHCKDIFMNEQVCIDHVHICKTPITFAGVVDPSPDLLPLTHVSQLICRYIRQQRTNGKHNADFPIGHQYKDVLAEIGISVITHMKRQGIQGAECSIIRNATHMYICRVIWN